MKIIFLCSPASSFKHIMKLIKPTSLFSWSSTADRRLILGTIHYNILDEFWKPPNGGCHIRSKKNPCGFFAVILRGKRWIFGKWWGSTPIRKILFQIVVNLRGKRWIFGKRGGGSTPIQKNLSQILVPSKKNPTTFGTFPKNHYFCSLTNALYVWHFPPFFHHKSVKASYVARRVKQSYGKWIFLPVTLFTKIQNNCVQVPAALKFIHTCVLSTFVEI